MFDNAVKAATEGDEMTKTELLKILAGLVVGYGADLAISSMLHSNVTLGTGWKRALKRLGIAVLAMKFGEDAERYFYGLCTEILDMVKGSKKEADHDGK